MRLHLSNAASGINGRELRREGATVRSLSVELCGTSDVPLPGDIAEARVLDPGCEKTPGNRRAEYQFSTYSITSLARARRVGGMVRASAFAALRLMMRSNLVGCSIGMSAGFAPSRILLTYVAAVWNMSGKFAP